MAASIPNYFIRTQFLNDTLFVSSVLRAVEILGIISRQNLAKRKGLISSMGSLFKSKKKFLRVGLIISYKIKHTSGVPIVAQQ